VSYSDHYSVTKLIEKVGKASSELLYVILPTVPTLTKAMVVAALGLLIPDFLPGGFVDDLAVLTAALT